MTDAFDSPSLTDLLAQRPFMRLWSARLFGTTASQMLLVALGWQMYDLALLGPVGSVVAGGLGTVLVALAWWRPFPSLAERDKL